MNYSPVKLYKSKIETIFGNGDEIVFDEIDTALICGFTAKHRGDIISQKVLKQEMVFDIERLEESY